MANTNRISAEELDVNSIATNLKSFLKENPKYSDYNFEGSNLSVLIDLLSYNTHYNNLYTNFSLNEVFLDSAIKRDSVVSLAKNIGYTPRSSIAARAVVTVNVSNVSVSAPEILILPIGSNFTAATDVGAFTFVTRQSYTAGLINGSYTFDDVEIFEGQVLSNRFLVQSGMKFIIPNIGCDTTTLKVKVQENSTSDLVVNYIGLDSIVDASANSLVYYTKEISGGLYEVYFGENVIGNQPAIGSIVTVEYLVTSGSVANGIQKLSFSGSLANGQVSVITKSAVSSGKDYESIESIKVNAPNSFSAQNRAVSPNDYRTIIKSKLPNIGSISVWGGEDNIPPVYGKSFISIKPVGRDAINSTEKSTVKNLLKGKSVVCIIPEFVDPEILTINVTTNVNVKPELTTNTLSDIQIAVYSTIAKYNSDNLDKFDGIFKHSVISTMIDSSEKSIVSNVTSIELSKDVQFVIGDKVNKKINIFNPIKSFTSSKFYASGFDSLVYMQSVGTEVNLTTVNDSGLILTLGKCGTVDLDTGTITLNNFTVTSLSSSKSNITFNIIPSSPDVLSKLNQIATIDLTQSKINIIVENTNNYVFSS